MSTTRRVTVLATESLDRHRLDVPELATQVHIEMWRPGSRVPVPDVLWREVEVLFTSDTFPTAAQAPRLRWVQLYSAGADKLEGLPLFGADVSFTTASGVHAVPSAEYAMAMLLSWAHRLPQMRAWQEQRTWPPHGPEREPLMPVEIWGKTMGIVGYGSIGRQTARIAAGLGMRVVAMQRGDDHRDRGFTPPGVGDSDGSVPVRFYPPEALHELLGASDVVLIAAPLTRQTAGMFDTAAFAAMRTGSFLINVARGGICDEMALLRALEDGHLGGAAFDVFEQEPLPPDNPLWQAPNLLISPHCGGMNPHYAGRVSEIFVANLRRYLAGAPLVNLVDKQHGY